MMKKLLLIKNKKLNLIETKIPKISSDECLIKVSFCGICSSDIPRIYEQQSYYYPIALGHEISGKVIKVGNKSKSFKIDDKVSVYPLIPCRKCEQCKQREYNKCKKYRYYGSRNDGGYSEYLNVKKWNLFKIQKKLDLRDAALLEPLSVCCHAINKVIKKVGINYIKKKSILIIGSGFLGILIAQILKKEYNNSNITIIDKNLKKLKIAKKYSKKIYLEKNIIKNNRLNDYFNLVIETSGASSSFNSSIKFIKNNGVLLWMGNITENLNIPKKMVSSILRKEATILGSWNSNYEDWNFAQKLIKKGIKPSKLISHYVNLSEVPYITKRIYNHKIRKKKFNYLKTAIRL